MELKELVGKHFLSGIETGTEERSKRFYGNEIVSYVKFCIDGVNYMAVEDPCDGYRSYCGDLDISETPCKIQIPTTEVLCTMRPDGAWGEDNGNITNRFIPQSPPTGNIKTMRSRAKGKQTPRKESTRNFSRWHTTHV